MKRLKKSATIILNVSLVISLVFSSCLFPHIARAAFDNSNVISDAVFSNKSSMTAAEINNFLKARNSFFADYIIPESVQVPYPTSSVIKYATAKQGNSTNGMTLYGKTVAQLIFDEANEHGINPQIILATMEKESSAVTMQKDQFASSPSRVAWPMFYMYDETMGQCLNSGQNCSNESYFQSVAQNYGGVGQQIAYAAAFLGTEMNEYSHGGRCLKRLNGNSCSSSESYNQPITIDKQTITAKTIGTRILYLYTPHIAGAQSFFDIFSGWWGVPNSGSASAVMSNSPTNDTTQDIVETYNSKLTVTGTKQDNVQAYFEGQLIAGLNTENWQNDFTVDFGTNNYSIEYKDGSGNVVGKKTIQIVRHKLADINGDGKVNALDLSILANYWGKNNPAEPLANMNHGTDNEVNVLDLSILAANWTG